ncbi:MAG: tyrosine-type recombinase/integrase, partial [Methylococcales bacterium]|nr:tyrosine-type recombinase/integrase [Methylococcales bacterium]
ATIVIRRNFVTAFLLKQGINLSSQLHLLSAKEIHDYIIEVAPPLHRASKKHLTSSIRSFLRFAYIKGYLINNLVEVVPVITTRKLERLPESITWENIQKLLTLPDKKTPAGRRDLAVMMLCIHYGVRIGQVTTLKLSDIHWEEGFICFAGCKWSNSLRLPLLGDVAEALLDYIKMDRRNPDFEEVFLTLRGQQRPLSEHNHYASNLLKYYVKAGVSSKFKGSRHFRHAFATRLLSQKVSIKTIADLLGHRHIETTFIYTKVDIDQLRTLAREWPEDQQ